MGSSKMETHYSFFKNDAIIAAKVILKNTKINREYFSFITPEAYYSLKDWMELIRYK